MLLPVNCLLSDVHDIVHPESELNQLKSGFEPQKEVVAERTVLVGAEAKTEVAYYGQTKSEDEFAGKEVAATSAVIVGAEAKTEVAYYGQTKSEDESAGKEEF